MMNQLFPSKGPPIRRPESQLLKWIGNKFKYAVPIVSQFPSRYGKFIEPFVGTGAILATLASHRAIAGDTLTPLIEMWRLLQSNPEAITSHYKEVIARFNKDRDGVYSEVLTRYNSCPNPLDLVVLSRTCYGGVMRFTKEGRMSTPIGPHKPIAPSTFSKRCDEWRERVRHVLFVNEPFFETMAAAERCDIVYCDPPYVDSQSILYGSQNFSFPRLIKEIESAKRIGAKVALSIDGIKKSGRKEIELEIPEGLFERSMYLECGSSMLKRFQNGGRIMIGEDVNDRLLLTW